MTVSRVRELLTLCVAACVFSSCARDPDGARFAPAAPTAAAILGGADRSADGMAPGQLSGLREREARRCLQWRCPSRVSAAELGRQLPALRPRLSPTPPPRAVPLFLGAEPRCRDPRRRRARWLAPRPPFRPTFPPRITRVRRRDIRDLFVGKLCL